MLWGFLLSIGKNFLNLASNSGVLSILDLTQSKASITVLPVTKMLFSDTFSEMRFSLALGVGAK